MILFPIQNDAESALNGSPIHDCLEKGPYNATLSFCWANSSFLFVFPIKMCLIRLKASSWAGLSLLPEEVEEPAEVADACNVCRCIARGDTTMAIATLDSRK